MNQQIQYAAERATVAVEIWRVDNGWHDDHLKSLQKDKQLSPRVRDAARRRFKLLHPKPSRRAA